MTRVPGYHNEIIIPWLDETLWKNLIWFEDRGYIPEEMSIWLAASLFNGMSDTEQYIVIYDEQTHKESLVANAHEWGSEHGDFTCVNWGSEFGEQLFRLVKLARCLADGIGIEQAIKEAGEE